MGYRKCMTSISENMVGYILYKPSQQKALKIAGSHMARLSDV